MIHQAAYNHAPSQWDMSRPGAVIVSSCLRSLVDVADANGGNNASLERVKGIITLWSYTRATFVCPYIYMYKVVFQIANIWSFQRQQGREE